MWNERFMTSTVRSHNQTGRLTQSLGGIVILLAVLSSPTSRGAQPKFFDDDPIQREPETQDASKVSEWEIDLFVDLTTNLFGRPGDPRSNVRAQNINTIDEVPDSNWFTNRIGTRPVPIDEATRGPVEGDGPMPGIWTIIRPKQAGFAPGFTMRDQKGETWFVSFDARGYPEAATSAIMVANKIFWTLGYYQVENHLISIHPGQMRIAESARIRPPSGAVRPMRQSDVDDVFRRSHRSANGSYRAVAGRGIRGRILGGFRYYGTRPDDPNDVVPHEHRRELRALKVFGAWTNLVDMKAGNTLDTLIEVDGRSIVRHYLQDVGSTFGTGALGFREYDEGWEYLFQGGPLMKRLLTLGLAVPRWATVDYVDSAAVGRFEGERFDPKEWKPRIPTAAFLRARADDNFWAARRVLSFSEELIRAIAKTGGYTDDRSAQHLADVLIQRRNKIGQTFLTEINPVVDVALAADGIVTFDNAAVLAGVAKPPASYTVSWARFDNTTARAELIGTPVTVSETRAAPPSWPSGPGTFVKVQILASGGPASWSMPIDAYFRRSGAGWSLVGFERLPADGSDPPR
jgi:hypothetical protein